MDAQRFFPKDENEMLVLGGELSSHFRAGDVVLFSGDLGAGKTTLVRGILAGLGYDAGVRSPTFSLIQLYDTTPPVAHVDLYRVQSYAGLGLEDYLDSHILLIEWSERAVGLVREAEAWKIEIDFQKSGRLVRVTPPSST